YYTNIDEEEIRYGIRIYTNDPSAIAFMAERYSDFDSFRNSCQQGTGTFSQCPLMNVEPFPFNYISTLNYMEAIGWSQLTQSITKEFNYSSSGTQFITQNTKTYTYNTLNKLLATVVNIDNNGDEIKSEYTYLSPISDPTQNRISDIQEIKVSKNQEIISKSFIDYQNFTSFDGILPSQIKTSKENQPLEVKIIYEQYDTYGNPLTISQPNGMKISYIWGYNHTQPVAKIENMAYSAIPANLIADIHGAVDNATLETKLDLLRNNAALANAMVTTYIYKPLIGVTKITDPKGDEIYYEYDAFNRLKTVKDKDGKLLSENEYHYRTQQP
uniref:RHS repeat domain-containing protein n=2 Tax=Flavobacterium sp. TaxID=239 RepID=UPI004049F4AA